ncbi:decapping and exoribonuclease protein-like [Augochlora pura]
MLINIHNITRPEDDLTTPQIVGSYSIDGEGDYYDDLSSLKYLKRSKNFPYDLNDTQGSVSKLGKDNKIDYLLHWITLNFDQIKTKDLNDVNEKWLEADFICYRGLLVTLLATPYDTEGWLVCASKLKGTIYLCAYDTDAKKQRELKETPYEKRCSLWGHKFEQYMLAASPTAEPDLSVPLNLNALFGGVFKSQLGNKALLYAGEIDGIYSKNPILEPEDIKKKDIELVELKTINKACVNRDGKLQKGRSQRTLKWCLQCHMVGIQRIICGCRDTNGFVDRVKEWTVDGLKNDFQTDWNFERCTQFASGLLESIREVVTRDYNECLYQFTFEPTRQAIRVQKLKPTPDSEYTFLHSEYINAAKRHFGHGEIPN